MIRAFLIDLFDTLVHIDEGAFLHWRGEMARLLGLPEKEFCELWMRHAPDRFTGKIKDTSAMLAIALSHFRAHCSDELLEHLVDRELEALLQHSFLYPGTIPALEEIGRAGYKKALVSNASCNAGHLISHLGLRPLLDELFFSFDIGIAKPDEGIYRHALTQLGLLAGECLFIGDGACQELDGAHRAGIHTVRIVQTPRTELFGKSEHADFEIGSLEEALSIAGKL
jgi:putative hydrolase of the HAD superfamily